MLVRPFCSCKARRYAVRGGTLLEGLLEEGWLLFGLLLAGGAVLVGGLLLMSGWFMFGFELTSGFVCTSGFAFRSGLVSGVVLPIPRPTSFSFVVVEFFL